MNVDGFIVFRGLAEGVPCIEVAKALGTVDNVEGLNPVQTLIPRRRNESAPNTYSGNFGLAEFPLHTDLAHWALPPRYIFLRCVRGAVGVLTRLLDGRSIIAQLGADKLRNTLVHPRRPMRNGKQLLRLLTRSDACRCEFLRWDSIYIRPASNVSAVVFDEMQNVLRGSPYRELGLDQPGDSLLIDNWRYLHGRSSAGTEDAERYIERVYLRRLYGDE